MTDLINAALPVLTDWRLLAAALATAIAGIAAHQAGNGGGAGHAADGIDRFHPIAPQRLQGCR